MPATPYILRAVGLGVGLTVHVGAPVLGAILVAGALPPTFSARTNTGITAPVTSPKF